MLTVRLSGSDLARTVVRSEPSVMVELTAAGKRLMAGTVSDNLIAWTARTRVALRPVMRPFLDLCRGSRWTPDFLTPLGHGPYLDDELGEVLATPAAVVGAELRPQIESGQLHERVRPLAAGDPAAIRALGVAIRAFHAVAVEPYWTEIVAAIQADRTSRGAMIVDLGIEEALRRLSPFLRWQADTLSYECPAGADIHLKPDGRGVVLVPSYLRVQPGFLDLGHGSVVLAYPIERRPEALTTSKTLADLLGRTRAAVLGAVNGARNTTDLARVVGISLGSVSQHTAVLRSAGLITTNRIGSAVLHSQTPLGRSLVRASSEHGFSVH
jgi:DNA-binding transcriptional ArsR family regulator